LLTHGDSTGLDYAYFVDEIIKDYCETQSIEDAMPIGQYRTNPVLSRYKTACGGVIKGCKPGDEPLIESIMWLALHEPSSTIALPFSPNVDEVYDFVRPSSAGQGMPGASDRMRMLVYDYTNGRYSDQYADTYNLVDIRNNTFPLQDSLFVRYEQDLSLWRLMSASQAEQPMANWIFNVQTWAKAEYETIYSLLNSLQQNDPVFYDFRLNSCYPNPFNSNTNISFSLSKSSPVSIKIFNVLGELIWQKKIKFVEAGQHNIKFNPKNANGIHLTGGIYFLTFSDSKTMQTQKLIYLP